MKSIFGTVGLNSTVAWRKLASRVGSKIEIVQHVAQYDLDKNGPSPKLLQCLDEISNDLCQFCDLAGAISQVHDDPKIRKITTELGAMIQQKCEELTSNDQIYNMLKQLKDSEVSLTGEETAIMNNLLSDATNMGGIGLTPTKRQAIPALRDTIKKIEQVFVIGCNTDPPMMELQPGVIRKLGIPQEDPRNPKPQIVPITNDLAPQILRTVSNEEVRAEVWRKWKSSAAMNMDLLKDLRVYRGTLARTLGFDTYSHYRMAQSYFGSDPEKALDFLNGYQEMLLPARKAELSWFQSCKRNGRIKPWDYLYYEYLYLHNYSFNQANIGPSRAWFTVDNCIRGLQILVKSVFHLLLVECEVTPEESWVKEESRHLIKKFEVRDMSNKLLGTIYMDMFKRPGKVTNVMAAAQVIRLRKNRHFKIGDLADIPVPAGVEYTDDDEEVQTPIILMFGLMQPSADGNLNRITMDTLFHEFGHCMHNVLSETSYSALSGTRLMSEDLVEFPSTLFEKFMKDPAFIQQWAIDEEGNPCPLPMIEWMNSDRSIFSAYKQNDIINTAIMDIALNHEDPRMCSTDVLEKYSKHSDSYEPGTHYISTVPHLMHYASMYYTYPLGSYFADKLWSKHNGDIEALGDALRSRFLALGGTKSGNQTMDDLFEEEVSLEFSPELLKRQTKGNLPNF